MTHPAPSQGDARDDQTGRFVTQPNGRARPLSPHLQVWRWHITMAASILFRVTIGAATVGAVLLLAWIAAVAAGPEAYAKVAACSASPFGLFIWFGLSLVVFSFLLNGARHLINDTGHGLSIPAANLMSHVAVWGPIVLTIVIWVVLFSSGRVAV